MYLLGTGFFRLLLIVTLGVTAVTAGISEAQETTADDEWSEEELDALAAAAEQSGDYETVITGSISETRRFEAPRSVDTVSPQQIDEQQARSLPEAADQAEGVYLQQTNRGAGTPIIRGLLGPSNLILVDNVRFNTATFRTGPNQYLALLSPLALERLEVVRGPASVQYGSGAMGGIVHLITATPELADPFDWKGEASLGFSTADRSTTGAFELANKAEALTLLGGGELTRFGELRAGGDHRQPRSDYATSSWRAKAIWAPDESWSLTGTYLGARIDDAVRTDAAGTGDMRVYDNDDHLAYLTFHWQGEQTLSLINGTVSFHRLGEVVERNNCNTLPDSNVVADLVRCLNGNDAVVNRKRRYRDTVYVGGADLDVGFDFWGRRLRFMIGGDVYFDYVKSSAEQARVTAEGQFPFIAQSRGNFTDGSTYRTAGAYLNGEATVLRLVDRDSELKTLAGVRLANFGARADGVAQLGDVKYNHTAAVFAGGLQWLKGEWLNVFASYVQGFRAPNLMETTVFADTGAKFEVPNDQLEPERSDTVEVGVKLQTDVVEARIQGFYSRLSDTIDEVAATYNGAGEVDGLPVVQRDNVASGIHLGVEGAAAAKLGRLTVSSGLTYVKGDFEDSAGNRFPGRRIPPLFGAAGLRYDHPKGGAYAETTFRFALRQDRLHPSDKIDPRICETALHSGVLQEACTGTPGWYTINARAGMRFTEHLELRLTLNNLTDQKYRTHGSGFFAPGFDARVAVAVAF